MSPKRLQTMWRVTMWATLSCFLVIAPSFAAPPPAKEAPAKPKAKAKGPSGKGEAPRKKAMLEVVTELHEVKMLLETAKHDYDGHRAKAHEHVRKAIHELTPFVEGKKLEAAVKKIVEGGSALGPIPGEPQAESDARLRKSHEMLTHLHEFIPTSHDEAISHVKKAHQELATALSIK